MADQENTEVAEQFGDCDRQSSHETENTESPKKTTEQANDDSPNEQEEVSIADCADGKQLQVILMMLSIANSNQHHFVFKFNDFIELLSQVDIMEEFSATFITLNELWVDIGFEPKECESSSADMVLEMKRVLSNKISTTQEIKSGLNSQIRLANARFHCSNHMSPKTERAISL